MFGHVWAGLSVSKSFFQQFLKVNINSWIVDVHEADAVTEANPEWAAEEKAELVSLAIEQKSFN